MQISVVGFAGLVIVQSSFVNKDFVSIFFSPPTALYIWHDPTLLQLLHTTLVSFHPKLTLFHISFFLFSTFPLIFVEETQGGNKIWDELMKRKH